MTHYEVAFSLQHDCPYNEFSKVHPSVIISHWCNWSKDVLEIGHRDLQNDSEIKLDIQNLTKSLGAKIVRRSFAKSSLQVVLMHCACDKIPPPTLPAIEKRNCLEIQPAVYSEGWEWYRVIAFSERDLKNLFKDLDESLQGRNYLKAIDLGRIRARHFPSIYCLSLRRAYTETNEGSDDGSG